LLTHATLAAKVASWPVLLRREVEMGARVPLATSHREYKAKVVKLTLSARPTQRPE